MGRQALRLPRYVHAFTDRHGKARYYFRRAGFENAALPGLPYSAEFLAAYTAALEGRAPLAIGASRIKPGSMRDLAASYFASPQFVHGLAESTQGVRRNIVERFCREHGDLSAATLERRHVEAMMAARADKPDSANGLRAALRALMVHAVAQGWRRDDPTQGIKKLAGREGGFHAWTEPELAQFEARHPIGSKPRLAYALALWTAQRRSDVVMMGRQHITAGAVEHEGVVFDAISIRQQKRRRGKQGAELYLPILPELQECLDLVPRTQMTFLETQFGRPFTKKGFGGWFRDRCNEAGLPHCSLHGLRKAAAARFAEWGFSDREIMSWTGHRTAREVTRYTASAEQKRLARGGFAKAIAGTSTGKPLTRFAKAGGKP